MINQNSTYAIVKLWSTNMGFSDLLCVPPWDLKNMCVTLHWQYLKAYRKIDSWNPKLFWGIQQLYGQLWPLIILLFNLLLCVAISNFPVTLFNWGLRLYSQRFRLWYLNMLKPKHVAPHPCLKHFYRSKDQYHQPLIFNWPKEDREVCEVYISIHLRAV